MSDQIVPYEGPVVTRKEAKSHGLNRYFTGMPCSRGHIQQRYVNDSCKCVQCSSEDADKSHLLNPRKPNNPEVVAKWRLENRQVLSEKARARYSANKDAIAAKNKFWTEQNAERVKANQRRWREENAERCKEHYRRHYLKNRQAFIDRATAHGKKHPENGRSTVRNRRARLRNTSGRHTRREIEALLLTQRHLCAACKKSLKHKYHVDHIQPLSKGGGNGIENIQLLCPSCNLSKGHKDPYEWARINGRLF